MRTTLSAISILLSIIMVLSCSTESTPVYQLTMSAEPSEAGAVTPSSGEYEEGEQVEITANPNEHWVFERWQGDHAGNTNPASITLNSDKVITALFIKREYPLTIVTEGEGTVAERVVQQKTSNYPHGTIVELTAEPSPNWTFAGWSGDFSGLTNPFELTINSNKTIVATFEREVYQLSVTTDGNGSVNESLISGNLSNNGYAYESVVELKAETDTGWEFYRWQGDVESGDNPINVTIDSNKSIQAIFRQGVTDIDGNFYESVKIGNQWWMTENLKTTRYQDGTEIPHITNDQEWSNTSFGAWSYYNNDSQFNNTHGKLYNWYAVSDSRSICPVGWRIPTESDFIVLDNHLGQNAGGKIKVTGFDYWNSPNIGATNESGLSLLGSGARRESRGEFSNMGIRGYLWSSTEINSEDAFYIIAEYNSGELLGNNYLKGFGRSARCIAD